MLAGNYTGSTVGLYSNGLTTFEASVFKEMLEQMVLLPPYGSRLDVYSSKNIEMNVKLS